jgi:ribosomal protein S6--L-glutamate ligase
MHKEKQIIGWQEWCFLPDLDLALKAKIDTGATTSALHAVNIKPFTQDSQEYVSFEIKPFSTKEINICCKAKVTDMRTVVSSSGCKELRYVIETIINIGQHSFITPITLTDRDSMYFRMLLGRSALEGYFIVDVEKEYEFGKNSIAKIVKNYNIPR